MKDIMIKHRSLKNDQSGFASIVIALVMIIVFSLLSLGFAQIARREQKGALDKQLATQAYYASETGINDVIKNLAAIPDSPNACLDTSNPAYGLNESVNASSGVGYTCVMVNKHPPNIVWSNVAASGDRSSRFATSSPMGYFDVMWGPADGSSTPRPAAGGTPFPTQSVWNTSNAPAVIKLSVTPFSNSFDRFQLQNNTFTVYLYPKLGSPNVTVNYATANTPDTQGTIVGEQCGHGGQYPCQVTIRVPQAENYLIRVHNYYDASNIQIGNLKDPLGNSNAITLNGAQAVIDVTGKAQDVLKRLQVRSPINKVPNPGDYAAQAQNICKRLETQPAKTDFVDGSGSATSPGDACYLAD